MVKEKKKKITLQRYCGLCGSLKISPLFRAEKTACNKLGLTSWNGSVLSRSYPPAPNIRPLAYGPIGAPTTGPGPGPVPWGRPGPIGPHGPGPGPGRAIGKGWTPMGLLAP